MWVKFEVITCVDPEGGGTRGPEPQALENHKSNGLLRNTGPGHPGTPHIWRLKAITCVDLEGGGTGPEPPVLEHHKSNGLLRNTDPGHPGISQTYLATFNVGRSSAPQPSVI